MGIVDPLHMTFGDPEPSDLTSDPFRGICPGCVELNEKYDRLLKYHNAVVDDIEAKAKKSRTKKLSWYGYKGVNTGFFGVEYDNQVLIWFDENREPIRFDFKGENPSFSHRKVYLTLIRHGADNKWFDRDTGKCYDVGLDDLNKVHIDRGRAVAGIKLGDIKKCKVLVDTNRSFIIVLEKQNSLDYW